MLISKKNSKFSAGLTLIEILVVIAIIAILATIVFVAIGNQRQRARLAGAAASVKSTMTIAAACTVSGGTVSDPPDGRGPSDYPVCSGASSYSQSVWPKLPEKCRYCGAISDLKINFECRGASSCGEKPSFCSIETTECVQND